MEGTMLATFAFDVCHDVYRAAREVLDTKIPTLNLESSGKYTWRPDRQPRLAEFVADFARAGERALGDGKASRLTMFRVFYLGGAEYHAARRHLGISDLTWSDWTEEIRTRVGKELARSGVFPPYRYFHAPTVPVQESTRVSQAREFA
jgi:hypothetical protein